MGKHPQVAGQIMPPASARFVWLVIGALSALLLGIWVLGQRTTWDGYLADLRRQCGTHYRRARSARDTSAVDQSHPNYYRTGIRGSATMPEPVSCGVLRASGWPAAQQAQPNPQVQPTGPDGPALRAGAPLLEAEQRKR
jgi:hypothetical protein